MRFTSLFISGLVAGSLLLGAGSGALAAKAKAQPRVVVVGQVSSLSTTTPATFTLTYTPKKIGATPVNYQVTATATTKLAAAKGTTGSLQNGDYAIVIGTKATTGVTADRVIFSTTAFKARQVAVLRLRLRLAQLTAARAHTVRGTVNLSQSAAGTLAVTVTNKTGVSKTVTLSLTAATKFRVGTSTPTTTAPTFTDGEKVVVRYKADATTHALTAVLVVVTTA